MQLHDFLLNWRTLVIEYYCYVNISNSALQINHYRNHNAAVDLVFLFRLFLFHPKFDGSDIYALKEKNVSSVLNEKCGERKKNTSTLIACTKVKSENSINFGLPWFWNEDSLLHRLVDRNTRAKLTSFLP